MTLSDAVISALVHRQDILREFPSLKVQVKEVRGRGCRCHGGVQRVIIATEYDRIRGVLLGMSQEAKNRFKALLRVGNITLFLRGPGGVVKHTI